MLIREYFKWLPVFLTTLLLSEHIPLIKTIDAGPSEASQLLSAVSEFANGVKDNIVGMVTRPSDFIQDSENEDNQTSSDPAPSPVAVELPLEPPPEPPQPPETPPINKSTSRFWRMEGTKIILELDLELIPGFGMLRRVFEWVTYWFEVLSSNDSVVDPTGQSYWIYIIAPAALGFFGGLGFGLGGRCRWCLSRRKPPKVVEKAEPVVKETERKTPANAYFESLLRKSYMMPSTLQHVPDPRLLGGSAPISPIKLEPAEETNSTIDRIAKKEEDADPLTVPPSLSDSSWYSPGSPLSPTRMNSSGLDLPPYEGFQPKPTASHPNGLPTSLLGSFSVISSPRDPQEQNIPQISDPWSDYTPGYTPGDRTDPS